MERALRLVEERREELRGRWVAVKEGRILFTAPTYKDIYQMIWDSGERGDIFIIYVPTPEEEAYRKMELQKLGL